MDKHTNMNLRDFNQSTGLRRPSIDGKSLDDEEQLANLRPIRRSVLLANSIGHHPQVLNQATCPVTAETLCTPVGCNFSNAALRASSPLTASLPSLDPLTAALSPVHAYRTPVMKSKSTTHLLRPGPENNNDLRCTDQNANNLTIDHYPLKSITIPSSTSVITLDRGGGTVRLHPPAVDVQNVSLVYGHGKQQVEVLKDLHMQVEVGCIYALLGSSGCGKTSLLKMILNQKRPTSGVVRIYGYRTGMRKSGVPGNGVGYMPQELALCGELSIAEMLYYFGKVGLLTDHQIQDRTTRLAVELQLPPLNQVIDTLSGGQKRRVSLGIALLLQARLLVLDEPTVGVDPLLRAHIWDMLRSRAEYGCTTLITTHYVEEARSANVVGFLRDGRLLAQGAPNELQASLNCDTLEHVFHRLCLQQLQFHDESSLDARSERGQDKLTSTLSAQNKSNEEKEQRMNAQEHSFATNDAKHVIPIDSPQRQLKQQLRQLHRNRIQMAQQPLLIDKLPFHEPSELGRMACWMRRQTAVAENCWKLSLRRPGTILAQYLLPILTTMLFCVCIGSTPNDIRIGVLSDELCSIPAQALPTESTFTGWNATQSDHNPFAEFPDFLIRLLHRLHPDSWSDSAKVTKRVRRNVTLDDTSESFYDTTTEIAVQNVSHSTDQPDTWTAQPNTLSSTTINFEDIDDEIAPAEPASLYNEFRTACFGELFLQQIDSFIFKLKRVNSETEAQQLTRAGSLWGYVKIPNDFSRATMARLFFADFAANINLADSQIAIHADLTNRVLVDTVQRSLRQSYVRFVRSALERANQLVASNLTVDSSEMHSDRFVTSTAIANDSNATTTDDDSSWTLRFNPNVARSPIEQQESVFGAQVALSDFFGVRDFAAPGVLTVVAFSISFALTAFDLVIELEGHVLQRHLTAGVSNLQFVLGHCASRLPFTCTSGPLLLALCVYTFDLPCRGSFVGAALLLTMQSVCGMCQALLVSALCPNAAVCAAVSNGFLVLLFIISGVFWSVETLPLPIRWFSRIQPTSIPCESLRGVLARGLPLSDPLVQLGFEITSAWSVFYFWAAVYVFYRRTRS